MTKNRGFTYLVRRFLAHGWYVYAVRGSAILLTHPSLRGRGHHVVIEDGGRGALVEVREDGK